MSEEAVFLPPKPTVLILAPGASRSIDGPGTFARIMEASGPLKIGFNLGTTFPAEVGQAYGTPFGQKFNRVTLENPSETATVTGLIVTGDLIIYDDRLHVISNKTNGLALDGTDGTGIVPPAGAAGIRGWLSGIYSALSGGTININTTGMSTEVTLAALKARADLLATDAKLELCRALLAAGATATKQDSEIAKLEAVRLLLAGTLAVSGPLTDAQLRASAVKVDQKTAAVVDDVADVACANGARTLVLAADVDRKSFVVTNPAASGGEIRVGGANVAANRGTPLQPGQAWEFGTSGAVYVWNASGGALNVPVSFSKL